jgi:hypothetical protein
VKENWTKKSKAREGDKFMKSVLQKSRDKKKLTFMNTISVTIAQ